MKLPGTSTQEEIIHIVLGKLDIHNGQTFLDIGCGSGAVSEAASHFTDKICGLDLRPEAIEASRSRVPFGIFLLGEASQLLSELHNIDRCFIGGTRGIERFFPLLIKKANPGCKIVANLARLGMASKVVDLMKEHGMFQELIQIQILRGYELSGDMALKPNNPIFMAVGKC
jgi:cobalt-precorrin-6B (C15)-methyltransferase